MAETSEHIILDFYRYPSVGSDDWRYLFQTAQVRMLEMHMLSRTTLMDMANADNFEQAVDLLGSSEYVLPPSSRNFAEAEKILQQRRKAAREIFSELMLDKQIVKLFKSRDDFANMRLAIRRTMTKRPLGRDFSDEGNVTSEQFIEAFEQENYDLLPEYMQRATEEAVLAYYQNKDIRQIDYAIDRVQAEHNLLRAKRLKNIFLEGLFRIQIDLVNIRTLLRLKFTESGQRDVFFEGGYIEMERLEDALDTDYEALGQLFFATPYYEAIESGSDYFVSHKSFLKIEQSCEEHLTGFLKTTIQIVTGPQPIIAYLLMKENEIRTVRLILTGKKNSLDTKLILDRMGE